jgi:hypothetical protein
MERQLSDEIVVSLIVYAVLAFWYGHDRTAGQVFRPAQAAALKPRAISFRLVIRAMAQQASAHWKM